MKPKPSLPPLPIHEVLPRLKEALAAGSAVLAAPPGSGKTTIVPLALLEESWLAQGKILILEPRRLATRAAAARMSAILGEPVGQTVGYQVRFDRQISTATRIEVLTEGILTRRIQNDPELTGVSLIIFDEFHERSIHADLALALCLDLCQLREDLRLLVMSATLDAEPIAKLLGNVPIITGTGQCHEVRIEYLDREQPGRISGQTAAGIRRVAAEQSGDILVFLPGVREIKEVHQLLTADRALAELKIVPLFGDLGAREQDQAILPDPTGRRRIILATAIAETSLTIEGIRGVVDSGWSRRPRFEPGSGLTRLATMRVSRAVAHQRAGRAGRLGPGYCLRLWTLQQHQALLPFHPPEIASLDLAEVALELALWGIRKPEELRWLDPPRSGPYQQARELLIALGAITESGQITAEGRQMAALPCHPRLAHLLLKATRGDNAVLACDLAALLSERDLLTTEFRQGCADLQTRLQLLGLWRKKGASAVYREGGDPEICRRVDQLARQWRDLLSTSRPPCDYEEIGNLLVFAYPDRIARRRPGQRDRYLLASGRGACLAPNDPLATSEYLVAAQLDAGVKEGKIFLAAPLSTADIEKYHGELITTAEEVRWDERAAKVVAMRTRRLGAIIIDEQTWPEADPVQINAALLQGIRQMGSDCLPWGREARQLQARVACLRLWQPEADWPDLGDEQLLADLSWLEPYLPGIGKREQLQQLDLVAIFQALLGWNNQQSLEEYAPSRITVPSGSRIAVEYRPGEPPLLAVRIQEMFGQMETPTVCGGKVPLLLHLLSPARRPIQITSDLAGFWERSYPEVKKELKGRYPKHFWPNDPREAAATSKVKRKS